MYFSDDSNPFAPIRAADYTDEQINGLWVELGAGWMSKVLEPRSTVSKYILGSKGSGKTHLLRYQSYSVARLRAPDKPGLALVQDTGCLAIFLRTTNMDAGRFELSKEPEAALKQLFSVHLELKLLDLVGEALQDVRSTTPDTTFNDRDLLQHLAKRVADPSFSGIHDLQSLRVWVSYWLRTIDDATNAAAFTGALNLRLPFSTGDLALPMGAALRKWHPAFEATNLIYVLDEIENLSVKQQEVLNTLVRYAEGRVAFRMTGRLYARKTLATIAGGEENREGSEFSVTRVDDILRGTKAYGEFATKFIAKRLGVLVGRGASRGPFLGFDPRNAFEEPSVDELVQRYAIHADESRFTRFFREAFSKRRQAEGGVVDVLPVLVGSFPPLLQRLNVLLFCKKLGLKQSAVSLAEKIRRDCEAYLQSTSLTSNSYATAVGHWKWDLFAQLCRESKRKDAVLPYAGFATFVAMSAHNPRNLLVLLGKVYEIAAFKEVDFGRGGKISVEIQTSAAMDAARFCFEGDSNYGLQSDQAREAATRLAELLRTARYALNVPEVSPLAISFDNDELTPIARRTLESAVNYSLLFEIGDGRPDRNTQRILRKVQLSPMLSPRWGLPTGRRGDISVSGPLLNAIFDPTARDDFGVLLRQQSTKWNFPFSPPPRDFRQNKLF
ncbi:hypothetical protein [Methylibium sp. Pch-M]|uniref:ORC-CDC6 family AAA ATPase n=1 Tax=Methylibium sp. Pch-M TaxID=2082386 RepID=UPI00101358C6|nr:hypothetical protein [Methylibium sp. Pch-M]